jgi:hypothetical protein
MNGPVLRKTASGVLAFLLLFYVGYQVYRMHYSPVRTEPVSYFTASDSVQTTVVAIRKETLLTSPAKGVADYVIQPGDRVSKGGVIAKIYETEEQVSAQRRLEDADRAIAQLQNLQKPGSTYSFNADSSNERICLKLTGLLQSVNAGDLSQVSDGKSGLLDLLNERQIGTGKEKDFNVRIKALQAQRDALAARAANPVGSIVSPAAGYFIQSTDGMENAFDISRVTSITCDRIRQLESAKKSPVAGTVGKIDGDYDWYLVGIVPADRVVSFRQLDSGAAVSVRFPIVSGTSVSASVAAVNQKNSSSEAAVVLKCQDINSALAGIRRETAEISVRQYTGLRVNRKAIHYETLTKKVKGSGEKTAETKKEVEGVYVRHGTQLEFRQIVPEFSTDHYVVCNPNPDEGSLFTGQTVSLYDEVVVEGNDLYDGKVIQ